MSQSIGSVCGSLYRLILLLLLVSVLAGYADAQNLAFTPGVVSLAAGDPTDKDAVSAANYSGPVNSLVPNGPSLVMNYPANEAFDKDGNLYIIEVYTHVLRVIAASGKPIPALPGVTVQAGYVYQIAGNGQLPSGPPSPPCSTGDKYGNGCPATEAFMNGYPSGIAVDPNGNVYIAGGTGQVRVIYAAGTVPGLTNPIPGYIYAVINTANTFGTGTNESPDGTPAVSAVVTAPFSVAVDGHGNIFFTEEQGSSLVRVVYAGGNLPYLPSDAIVGDIYTIGTFTPCGSSCSNAGGPVSQFTFDTENVAIGVDSSGNLYVAGGGENQVWGVYAGGTMPGITNPTPGNVYVVAGTGTQGGQYPASGVAAVSTPISFAVGGNSSQIAFDAIGNIYIARGESSVIKIDPSGVLYNILGGNAACTISPGDGHNDGCGANAISDGTFAGVAVDPVGNIYATDFAYGAHSLIRKVTVGSSMLDLSTVYGLANSTSVYVANSGSAALQLSGIGFTSSFSQVATGGSDCNSATSLAPGASCIIAIGSEPSAPGVSSGSVIVSSNALNASSENNTVAVTATAAQASSTTTMVASPSYPSAVNVGQAVTFTATVAPQFQDTATPTGAVAFISGYTGAGTGTTLGTTPIGSGGVAIFTTSTLAAGSYPVTAVYNGDTNFSGSTSSLSVIKVSSTPVAQVTLTSSATAINSGQSVTLTAGVTSYSGSGTPTGTVTFQVGSNPLPNGTVTLNGGTATLTTTTLPAGVDELVAVYSGDGNFTANVSLPAMVTVTSGGQLQFAPGTISLVAGSYFNYGSSAISNGTSSSTASFDNPVSVVVDSFGNTYVADNQTNQVYAVASGNGSIPGVASPVAGDIYKLGTGAACHTSASSPCGDGGSISLASFNNPTSLAIDAFNNIYVSDSSVVRKISAATGIINTIAGVWGGGKIGYTGDGGLATSAEITVTKLAADPNGNLYILDGGDFLVRKVDSQTGIITTVAGTTVGAGVIPGGGVPLNVCIALPCGDGAPATSASFFGPVGIAVDLANNIYIADDGESPFLGGQVVAVRKVDAKTGIISTVAGSYGAGCSVQGCGDGGPATSASFLQIADVSVDHAGDLYITDIETAEVREVNAQTGIINTVVGAVVGDNDYKNECGSAPCGDGGKATGDTLVTPIQSTFDSQGNLYVLDGGNLFGGEGVVREVPAGILALTYGSQDLGTLTPVTFTVANIGAQPLTLTGLSVPSPNYVQQATGGADCDASTSLSPGSSCPLEIAFFPTVAGALPATATISSNSTNAVSGQNTIALSGTGTGIGGNTPQTITFQPLPSSLVYGAGGQTAQTLLLSASSDATRAAGSSDTIIYIATGPATVSGSTLTILGAGTVKVTAYQFGDATYAAAAPVSQSLIVTPATLTVTAASPSITTGTVLTAPTYTIKGFVNGDTQQTSTTGAPVLTVTDASGKVYAPGSTPPAGTYTVTIQQGTLALTGAAVNNYTLVFANGTLSVTGTNPQTITFPALGNVSYGAPTITLGATSSSGLQVSYTVLGPATVVGNLLTVTGTGSVAVTANQSGNATYAAASPATVSFIVNKVPLTVTANNVSAAQGSPLPTLTYTITGFIPGENQSVVTGSPTLTTTATSSSPVGQYPITVTVSSLVAANYTFTTVAGTLTMGTAVAQTISFPAIANVTYGATPITLGATSSAPLAVSYSVVGPATLSGPVLTINGAGTIAVTASQVGNSTYGPASPVTQSFTVSPAVLTVTANNATRLNDVQNPTFTSTISGFVNGDTQNIAVSGTPALSTVATTSSPIGTYPITIAVGTLKSANYTFNLLPGTLTITTGGPIPDFTLSATPQSLTVPQGQIVQATITLSPVNFYQGLVELSCGSLPANVSCTFSPATLAANGTNTPVVGTLTVNTNSAAPVVGQIQPLKPEVMSASFLYLPAGLAGLLLAFRRKQMVKDGRVQKWLMLVLMFVSAAGLVACGTSAPSSSSTLAQPGSSVITLTAADSAGGASHTINIGIKVE